MENKFYVDERKGIVFKAVSGYGTVGYDTYQEAKLVLIQKLRNEYNIFCDMMQQSQKTFLAKLQEVTSMVETEDCDDRIDLSKLTREDSFRELLKNPVATLNMLNSWYDEVGVKFSDGFMFETHSAALDWYAERFFGDITHLDRSDYIKMPKDDVRKALRIFEQITIGEYGTYNAAEVSAKWNES